VATSTSKSDQDPDEWMTGDEEMTGAQGSYPRALAEEAHEPVDHDYQSAEES